MRQKAELKRVLGLFEVTLSGIGIILGAGIYALIGEAAGLAGNAVWISFAISALVALLTGMSYAELSSMFPKASAEYEYTAQAFSRRPGFVVGWMIIFSGVIGAATVACSVSATISVWSVRLVAGFIAGTTYQRTDGKSVKDCKYSSKNEQICIG